LKNNDKAELIIDFPDGSPHSAYVNTIAIGVAGGLVGGGGGNAGEGNNNGGDETGCNTLFIGLFGLMVLVPFYMIRRSRS